MEKSKISKQNLYFSSAENNNTLVSYSLVKSTCRFCKKYVLVAMILFYIEKIKQFVCLVMLETDYLMNKH